MKKPAGQRNLPVFEAKKSDSSFLVIPVYGKGLWGPIWGYVSFRTGRQCCNGFPISMPYTGLCSITREKLRVWALKSISLFFIPFRGKTIFDDKGDFVSVDVVKGGADPSSSHQVDAISGGTITSKGLEAMLDSCLISYQTYFKMNN